MIYSAEFYYWDVMFTYIIAQNYSDVRPENSCIRSVLLFNITYDTIFNHLLLQLCRNQDPDSI